VAVHDANKREASRFIGYAAAALQPRAIVTGRADTETLRLTLSLHASPEAAAAMGHAGAGAGGGAGGKGPGVGSTKDPSKDGSANKQPSAEACLLDPCVGFLDLTVVARRCPPPAAAAAGSGSGAAGPRGPFVHGILVVKEIRCSGLTNVESRIGQG